MGFLDKLLGRVPRLQSEQASSSYGQSAPTPAGDSSYGQSPQSHDDRAIARYRYLLRTASPDQLEAMHAEAFEKLTPQQRQELLRQLSQDAPDGERAQSDSPRDLARAATRAEMRQPGSLQNTLSRGNFGGGMGSTVMGSMMGTIAGVVVGSMIADTLLDGFGDSPEAEASGGGAEQGVGGESGDGGDAGGDVGGETYAAEDLGSGNFGGGDFGAGDFGGFGGGDF